MSKIKEVFQKYRDDVLMKLMVSGMYIENVLAANKARIGLKYLKNKALGYFLVLIPILGATAVFLLILPDEYGSIPNLVFSVIIGLIAVVVFMLGIHIAYYKSYRRDPKTTWAEFVQRYSNAEKHSNDENTLDIVNAVNMLKTYDSGDPTFKLAAMLSLILFREFNPSDATRYVDELQRIASMDKHINWVLRESVQMLLQQHLLMAEVNSKYKEVNPFDPVFSALIILTHGFNIFGFNRINITIGDNHEYEKMVPNSHSSSVNDNAL